MPSVLYIVTSWVITFTLCILYWAIYKMVNPWNLGEFSLGAKFVWEIFLILDACFQVGSFFIARFFHLDIKVIIARAENCMFSNQTFLKVARHWENNNCLFFTILHIAWEWETEKNSISCKTQKSKIRRHAIFSSFNNYLYVYNWRNQAMNKTQP